MVGERSVSLRRCVVTHAGGIRSAIKRVKRPLAVSPRFPALRSSEQGESAPKARLRSVADGKQIKISAPTLSAKGGRSFEHHPGVGCPGLCV